MYRLYELTFIKWMQEKLGTVAQIHGRSPRDVPIRVT